MQKIKTFKRIFWNSLTKPSYYKDIIEAKFSFSFKYLLSLFLLTSFIIGVSLSVRVLNFISQSPKFVESTKAFMVETYPKELKLTLKEGKIVTNVKEPYFINLPENNKIAISTKGKAEDIKNLKALFLLTSDSLVISDNVDSYKVIPLSETLAKIPNGVAMDKTLFVSILDQFAPYALKSLPKIIIAISILILIFYPLIRGVFGFVFEALFLLPATLVLFVGVKILKKKLTFAKTYQMSLHGATIPILISFLLSGLVVAYPFVSIISWLAFFVFMFVVISKLSPRS